MYGWQLAVLAKWSAYSLPGTPECACTQVRLTSEFIECSNAFPYHRQAIFKMLALEQLAEKWPCSAGGGVVRPPPPMATGLRSRPLHQGRGQVLGLRIQDQEQNIHHQGQGQRRHYWNQGASRPQRRVLEAPWCQGLVVLEDTSLYIADLNCIANAELKWTTATAGTLVV